MIDISPVAGHVVHAVLLTANGNGVAVSVVDIVNIAPDIADNDGSVAIDRVDAQSLVALSNDGNLLCEQIGVVSGGSVVTIRIGFVGAVLVVGILHLAQVVGVNTSVLVVVDVGQDAGVGLSTEHLAQQGLAAAQVNVQCVPDHLGSVVTGQSNRHVHVFQASIQTNLGGLGVDVQSPGVAQEAFIFCVVAQSHQQHLSQLGAGQVSSGSKAAAANACHDAFHGAELNILVGPCRGRIGQHVGVAGSSHVLDSVLTAVDHHADQLCSLSTGDVLFGVVVAVFEAVDDTQCYAHINGLCVLDLILIAERCACAHDHDGEHHSQAEHQAENLL